MDGARDDHALEPEGRRAELLAVGEGLVDRVEVVERAPQSLDEQEHEGDGQQGEDDEEPPAGRRRRRGGGTAGPWCASDVGGLGGGLVSVAVSVTTVRRAAGALSRLGRRRLRHPQGALPAPAAQRPG